MTSPNTTRIYTTQERNGFTVGCASAQNQLPLASPSHVVENRVLLAALHQRLRDSENTHLVCPAKVDSITWPESEGSEGDADIRRESNGRAETSGQGTGAQVHLSTGRSLGARLVVSFLPSGFNFSGT